MRAAPGTTAPEVPQGTGPTVSALLPRAVLVAGAVLGVAAQLVGSELVAGSLLPALLPVLLAVVAAWRPTLPAALLCVAGLFVLAVLNGGGPDARDAVTVLAVHVVHVAAALTAVLPAGSRVEVAALQPTWRRFLLVQAGSQVVVVGAVLAATSLAR